MQTTLHPPASEWPGILAENIATLEQRKLVLGADTIRALRGEVLDAARKYTQNLADLAKKIGLTISTCDATTVEEIPPIVMAGHQPVVYHPGLLFKNKSLSTLCRKTGVFGINVVIDTDEGDGGRVSWPLLKGNDIIIKTASIGSDESIYRDQRVRSSHEVATIFDEVSRDLVISGCEEGASKAQRVSKIYQALSGAPIAVANAIVRMHSEEGCYLEVPLSVLIGLPHFREALLRIVDDASRFASVYNGTLEAFRRARKIKNPANPFPNMRLEGGYAEVPLWDITNGKRSAVRVDPATGREQFQDRVIAPRGSVVTLLLRGLCSDLFVHGLGGEKYDPFVDLFAFDYLGVRLPQFVVASATQYLFPDQVKRYTEAREYKGRYKEIVSHTDTFFGSGIFSAVDEEALQPLVVRRRELLCAMQGAASAAERSAVAHALNEVNRQVKARIEVSAMAPILQDADIDDAKLARWSYREFPFFLF